MCWWRPCGPGDRPPTPDANLATLVSRLRAVFGPEVIAGDRHGWRFVARPRVEVDLEEAARLAVLAAHAAAGEPAAALAAYERLRQTLAEELGTDPTPESQALHLAILRGDPLNTGPQPRPERHPAGPWTHPGPGAGGGQGGCGQPRVPFLGVRYAPPPGGCARNRGGEGCPNVPLGPRPPCQATGWARTPGPPSQAGAWSPRTPGAPGADSSTAAPGDAGFVGREEELGDLARPGRGRWSGGLGWCWSSGRPGSARPGWWGAAAELAAATGGLVVQARCYEAERSLFLQPVAEAVRVAALASRVRRARSPTSPAAMSRMTTPAALDLLGPDDGVVDHGRHPGQHARGPLLGRPAAVGGGPHDPVAPGPDVLDHQRLAPGQNHPLQQAARAAVGHGQRLPPDDIHQQ